MEILHCCYWLSNLPCTQPRVLIGYKTRALYVRTPTEHQKLIGLPGSPIKFRTKLCAELREELREELRAELCAKLSYIASRETPSDPLVTLRVK